VRFAKKYDRMHGLATKDGQEYSESAESDKNDDEPQTEFTRSGKAVFQSFSARNNRFHDLMQQNSVVVLPRKSYQAWDNLPRLQILESDMNQFKQKEKRSTRIHAEVKPHFVGSPVRLPEQGGLLKPRAAKPKHWGDPDTLNEEEVQKSNRVNTSERAVSGAGSTEFFAIINELSIQAFRD